MQNHHQMLSRSRGLNKWLCDFRCQHGASRSCWLRSVPEEVRVLVVYRDTKSKRQRKAPLSPELPATAHPGLKLLAEGLDCTASPG